MSDTCVSTSFTYLTLKKNTTFTENAKSKIQTTAWMRGRTLECPQYSDLLALTCGGSWEDHLTLNKAPWRELGTQWTLGKGSPSPDTCSSCKSATPVVHTPSMVYGTLRGLKILSEGLWGQNPHNKSNMKMLVALFTHSPTKEQRNFSMWHVTVQRMNAETTESPARC